MKKFISFFLALFLLGITGNAQEILPAAVNININYNENKIEVLGFELPEEGTASIGDSSGETHEINALSVLNVLAKLDKTDSGFRMGELIYYPAFSALYLRCMTVKGATGCDNWLYEVNDESPSVGMDNFILKDGDSIEIYYDDSFLGGGDDEEQEVEEPEPEPETTRSSGGSKKRAVKALPDAEPETVQVALTTPASQESKPLVPAYIAFPEFYTPEEITDQQTSSDLSAAVTETGSLPSPYLLAGAGLVAIFLVAIFRN